MRFGFSLLREGIMRRFGLVLFLVVLLGDPGRVGLRAAAEEPAKADHAAAAHGGQGAPAGEKHDPLGLALDLTVWTIVVFAVLLFVLRKFAWGPMLEGLQKREQNIRLALEEAQQAREDAQKVRSQLQAEMSQAADKVRQMMDEARRDAQYMADEMVGKARSEIQGERDRLRREIDTARDQALQQLWGHAAQLAAMISSKAVRRELNLDDHRRLVDEAIAELRGAGNDRQGQVASART
jgi:F-type H+-transporting ATPase subunit b